MTSEKLVREARKQRIRVLEMSHGIHPAGNGVQHNIQSCMYVNMFLGIIIAGMYALRVNITVFLVYI